MTFLSSDFKLTFSAPKGTTVKPEDVTVALGAQYNARLTDKLASEIDATWEEKKKKHPNVRLFNGLKFRLGGVKEEGKGAELQIGITDYKSFIGTHYLARDVLEEAIGTPDYDAFMSHALGVESLVVSSDGVLVFIKRSDKVAEYPGFYCGPGGHAEPHKVIKDPSPDHTTLVQEMQGKEDLVLKEMFNSSIDEVVEELGLPGETLQLVGLLGVAVNTRTRNKPDLLYLIRCTLTADGIKAIYQKGEMAEKFESEQIRLVPYDKPQLAQMISDNQLTPPSAAAVQLILECDDLTTLN